MSRKCTTSLKCGMSVKAVRLSPRALQDGQWDAMEITSVLPNLHQFIATIILQFEKNAID